jgi:hypothetical protein
MEKKVDKNAATEMLKIWLHLLKCAIGTLTSKLFSMTQQTCHQTFMNLVQHVTTLWEVPHKYVSF